MIYMIRIVDQPLVKIGHARNPRARLRALQTGAPHELELMAYTAWPNHTELEIHHKLHEHWVRGEWFRLAGKVEELVEIMQTGRPSLEEWLLGYRTGAVPSRLARVHALTLETMPKEFK